MLPLDLTYWFDIKLSTLCGNDATKDEKPLAALDDYVSLALTIPDISQESSGPIITSLLMYTPGVSAIFYFIIAKVFLEITWKLLSEFLSFACFNLRLFLKNEIFLPIIWLPPDSCRRRSNELMLSWFSMLSSAEFADKLIGLSLTTN